MSIVIDNITYQIENEDLPEIEYFEILTMGEIIKDNPTFIAFSREEIFNELYDFFKDSNKCDKITDLFFKDNSPNLQNYVFVANAQKKTQNCEYEDIQSFVDEIQKASNWPYKRSQTEKNKLMFAISYDNDAKQIRIKPTMNTNIQIIDESGLSTFYPIFKDDDTNIPVESAYYKKPLAVLEDALSEKITANLDQPLLFNHLKSDFYTDVNKLINAVKPKMKNIIEHFPIDKDDFEFDYNALNAHMHRFDTSLDDLTEIDFTILLEHLKDILHLETHKISYKKFKIKEHNVVNNKLELLNKIYADKKQHFLQLINVSEKMREDYNMLIANLEEEKININAPPLLYNNINDIVTAVINKDVSIEDIIENLSANKKLLVVSHIIDTLKGIITNDTESISMSLDTMTNKYKLLYKAIDVFFRFKFIDFYKDIKEVIEANDYSQYDGVPDIYKNNGNYEGMSINDGIEDFDFDDIDEEKPIKDSIDALDKYWLSIKYRDAQGFTEMLKFILPLIKKIHDTAKLPLNYERLSDELFHNFAGVPKKYDLMKNILHKADIKIADKIIQDIVKISPTKALNPSKLSALVSDDLVQYVLKCNSDWVTTMTDMLNTALAWWSLQIQDDIVNDTLVYQENIFMISYIDKWALDGAPLKDSKQGVLVYLCSICEDVLADNDYVYIDTTQINKHVLKIIDTKYKDIITNIREKGKDINKKRNYKGKETYLQLRNTVKNRQGDRLLNDYIDALLYMPSYQYKQLHKFLLGCCLQQIGKSFRSDSDIVEKGRDDLQKLKNKYAKIRLTQPKRYALYVSEGPKDEESDDEEILEQHITVKYNKSEFINDNAIQEWLQNMIDISPLLPSNNIETFIKSTKDAPVFAKQFIQMFCKTAGFKSHELETLLLNHHVNYKNIMLILCSIYKTYPTNNSEEEHLLLQSIMTLHNTLHHLDKLTIICNEYNQQDISRIRTYILCRALCLPCNVDLNNNGVLSVSVNVTNGFINNLMKLVYTTVTRYLRISKMPTQEENVAFITKIREENKRKILQVMNTKTPEERNLMNAIKKIGLKYEDDGDPDINNEQYNINDDYNDFEKDEVIMQDQEEYDIGDDDVQEYGFIYS